MVLLHELMFWRVSRPSRTAMWIGYWELFCQYRPGCFRVSIHVGHNYHLISCLHCVVWHWLIQKNSSLNLPRTINAAAQYFSYLEPSSYVKSKFYVRRASGVRWKVEAPLRGSDIPLLPEVPISQDLYMLSSKVGLVVVLLIGVSKAASKCRFLWLLECVSVVNPSCSSTVRVP